jgi:hypothetical protein
VFGDQSNGGAALTHEAVDSQGVAGELRMHELEGDALIELQVVGEKDAPHAARAEETFDSVPLKHYGAHLHHHPGASGGRWCGGAGVLRANPLVDAEPAVFAAVDMGVESGFFVGCQGAFEKAHQVPVGRVL